MGVAEEFCSKFHNLDGVTVNEKWRSFNKLLREYATVLKDERQNGSIVGKITPRNHLETLLRVEILNYCQLLPELLDVLTSGNDLLIRKVIKNDWFFQRAFAFRDAKQIVEEFLPRLSYSTRMKVLKNFALFLNDEDKLHQIFDLVKQKYGLRVAVPLLIGCSESKIKYVMENNPVVFSQGQLKYLVAKYPKLLLVYVEQQDMMGKSLPFLDNNKTLRFIESKDLSVFDALRKKHYRDVHYGRRATKKLFESEKENILKDPKKFKDASNWDKKAFCRKLVENGCFKKYFCDSFPQLLDDFSFGSIRQLLHYYPKSKQFELLKASFEEVYGVPLLESVKQIDKNILEMIPDINTREEIATKKMEMEDNIEYLVYQAPARCIPFFKNQMNLSSNMGQRKELIQLFVTACKVNNSLESLYDIIKYVSTRHRNDIEIVTTFLRNVRESFNPHDFSKEMWDVVNQLIEIFRVKEGGMYEVTVFLVTYIEFMYKMGQPTEDLLLKLMEIDWTGSCLFYHECENHKFLKDMIEKWLDLFPKVVKKEDLKHNYSSLISDIHSFNKKQPQFSVSLLDHPKLIQALKDTLKDDSFYYDITFLLCTKDNSGVIKELTDLYMEKHLKYSDHHLVLYFLKWYPLTLKSFQNRFIEKLGTASSLHEILNWLKKYDHLDFRQSLVTSLQTKLKETDESISKKRIMASLAILMYPEDYINYVDQYKPKSLSLDLESEEDKELFELQNSIVQSFKYITSSVVLPVLVGYCGGDYLKAVLAPLYKAFNHNPETLLYPFINQLSRKAVSVRKHAVFLTCKILNMDSIREILKQVSTTEKDPSLQKRFMITTFRCFCESVSEEFWELFKFNLRYIDDNDRDSLETLANQSYVPITYVSIYYQEIWDLIEGKKLNDNLRANLRDQLMRKMEAHIDRLPPALCNDVIDKLFLHFSPLFDYRNSINSFVYKYLLHQQEQNRFEKILELINSAKILYSGDQKWKKTFQVEAGNLIDGFCEFYFSNSRSPKWNKEQVLKFLKQLSNLYPDVDFFKQYLLLLLTLILVSSSPVNVEDYAVKISEFCKEIVSKYGLYILKYLVKTVQSSLVYFRTDFNQFNSTKLKFARALLNVESSEVNQILCIDILSNCDKDDEGYQDILSRLEASTYPSIQIELRLKN